MTTIPSGHDKAMLDFLAGDDAVIDAAQRIWAATGHLLTVQRALTSAVETYQDAIRAAGIPAEHAERLGAALILRLNHDRLLTELAAHEPHGGDTP